MVLSLPLQILVDPKVCVAQVSWWMGEEFTLGINENSSSLSSVRRERDHFLYPFLVRICKISSSSVHYGAMKLWLTKAASLSYYFVSSSAGDYYLCDGRGVAVDVVR
jgi:hypothetical protein